MRTDKIRKYLIPNIPYLFILWAFLKLGTAYRLAAGNDFAHKLIGLGQTIGPDRKSTRLNSSHASKSRMPSSA